MGIVDLDPISDRAMIMSKQLHDIISFSALRIGFKLPLYNFSEPNTRTLIENVTLIKEDNRSTEQTFGITIMFDDPGAGVRSASIQQNANQTDNFDYVVDVPGNDEISLSFGPDDSEINIAFSLQPDELLEGIESFRVIISSQGSPFPPFQMPVAIPVPNIPAFADTVIRIQDNDSRFIKS